ncbi:MAG: hypothetical protein EZS28_021133 [Streblomastix strix]|uniref:Uncharacterized protein n=1 Tax=Streblomastix strix TaxID=222440 RepID=A0A5J4VLV3_9EUKA|nr:MAG: hypothetical protein EZS28_021133 [Streblomastix strix]
MQKNRQKRQQWRVFFSLVTDLCYNPKKISYAPQQFYICINSSADLIKRSYASARNLSLLNDSTTNGTHLVVLLKWFISLQIEGDRQSLSLLTQP